MEIVADQNIPYVAEAFSDFGNVTLYPGREITSALLTHCDCLLVRTVTRVDQPLLDKSDVKFVGTATIGTDHIDTSYLQNHKIGFSNAAGCNAEAASEYVVSGLFALSEKKQFDPFKRRAGIIGFGNVGSRLYQKLNTLGIECLVNDPFINQHHYPGVTFVDLDRLMADCDLISLHVPLTTAKTSTHPTYHLFDNDKLQQLQTNCVLINAARGEVIDNSALASLLDKRDDISVFLDTWENEPKINTDLVNKVDLATPHIAGYSVEGRLRGTQMILNAACQHFNCQSSWTMKSLLPATYNLSVDETTNRTVFWQKLFSQHFNIWRDDAALRKAVNDHSSDFSKAFDALRKVYPDRLEYERFRITKKPGDDVAHQLRALQFNLA